MDLEQFDIRAEQVRKAKERCAAADEAYAAAEQEVYAARDNENAVYKEFMGFVRESAGLKSEFAK